MSALDPTAFNQLLQVQLPQLVDSLLVGTGEPMVRDKVNGMIAFAIGQMPGNATFIDAVAATIGQRITLICRLLRHKLPPCCRGVKTS